MAKCPEIELAFITRSTMKRDQEKLGISGSRGERPNRRSVIDPVLSGLLDASQKRLRCAIAPGGNQQISRSLPMPAWRAETIDGEASAAARSRVECAARLRSRYRPQPATTALSPLRYPLSLPRQGRPGYSSTADRLCEFSVLSSSHP